MKSQPNYEVIAERAAKERGLKVGGYQVNYPCAANKWAPETVTVDLVKFETDRYVRVETVTVRA